MLEFQNSRYNFDHFSQLKKYLLPLIMLFPLTVLSQTIVSGRVTNASDGKAMEFVNVGVLATKTSQGTTTNARGRYELRVPMTDSLAIRFTFTGFESQTRVVYPRRHDTSSPITLDVQLKPAATNLQEVTITDDASRTTGLTHIDISKLDDAVGPNSGVESILKTLPDVSSSNEMSSQYSVRGGSFDENLVYIDGVEIFRPMLIRSGQQEGMSIVNADMVDHIVFSPGGFDASYGDKISSVLDISYIRPTEYKTRISASFLGATAHTQGLIGDRFSYSVGLRYHTNQYIFSSLDTKGTYLTRYLDLQSVLSYRINDQIDLSLLLVSSHNRYGLIPESQTTTFGSFMQSMELDVYFDGQEVDQYHTLLGALTLTWHPSQNFSLKWINSVQDNQERETYDIQSQYWLYELGMGSDATVNKFDRGVGTFLEHARNNLASRIYNAELRGIHIRPLGTLDWGIKLQSERINDNLREWKWVDSAGFAMPTNHDTPGLDDTVPHNPQLQAFANADNQLSTWRASAFILREWDFLTRHDHQLIFRAGLRAQAYTSAFDFSTTTQQLNNSTTQHILASPRLSLSYKPRWQDRDMLFRIATGVYQQPPFYREARYPDGRLNPNIAPQTSYQTSATFDWNFHLWQKPFRLTADLYYKYITDLIPYSIDNLRLRYLAENSAVAYATGLSVRLNGEFVQGLESWASLSLMKTQEDIEGDNQGWLDRPTDQRLSFKLFFQDYLPSLPWWRMSLNFTFGTGIPVTFPTRKSSDQQISNSTATTHRLPNYFRVDWGNTIQLSRFDRLKHSALFRHIDDILVGVEVFNLFNFRNVASYIWVSDYDNVYYPVPNYLTARQINLKLSVLF